VDENEFTTIDDVYMWHMQGAIVGGVVDDGCIRTRLKGGNRQELA